MPNVFHIRDTEFEVVLCIILVLLKRTDDINHYLDIRQYMYTCRT
jgi:hypothetical protein